MTKKPNCIIIMDGYGVNACACGNAIACADSKNVNALISEYPSTLIGASGMDVGLPEGQMGNSEVGHLNMGAGRIRRLHLSRTGRHRTTRNSGRNRQQTRQNKRHNLSHLHPSESAKQNPEPFPFGE